MARATSQYQLYRVTAFVLRAKNKELDVNVENGIILNAEGIFATSQSSALRKAMYREEVTTWIQENGGEDAADDLAFHVEQVIPNYNGNGPI